MISAHYLGMPV
jgi:uncharacterized protein